MGKRHNKTHTLCRTTGKSNYHIQKGKSAKVGQFNWSMKPRGESLQVPDDLDTSRRFKPNSPTVSDTQKPSKFKKHLNFKKKFKKRLKNVKKKCLFLPSNSSFQSVTD